MKDRIVCLAVVAFLNEEKLLPTFLASLAGQTRRADAVLLVDDGSTDRSAEIAQAYAADHSEVTVLSRPPRAQRADRLVDAPELAAFLWAQEQFEGEYDVVVKMDADLQLAPEHFDVVLSNFMSRPRLGMAGTYLHVPDKNGNLVMERHGDDHIRGATRFYRRACLQEISPLPLMLGWDGADEVRARARGWETRSFTLPAGPSVHLRPTGAVDGRLRGYLRWGRCAYAVGAHPLIVVGGGIRRMADKPFIIGGAGYIVGWIGALVRRAPRAPQDILVQKRREPFEALRARLKSAPAD